ncbi:MULTISPECIES: sensor histidine kinase [Paenibacillus]|nr:histidine kinase [Paenibacillus borealis]
MMQLWIAGNKILLLLLVIFTAYFTVVEPDRWLVLLVLIYIAMNLLISIVHTALFRQALLLLLMVYLIGCAIYTHPSFWMLFPLIVYEFAEFRSARSRWGLSAGLLLVLLPMLYLPPSMLVLYSGLAVLSFLSYTVLRQAVAKVCTQSRELEQLRTDLEQKAKHLLESHDLIKTSEYTVKLEERNRLTQEIHDGIGHSMTGALIQMEAAKRLLSTDPVTAGGLLQNAINISKQGIEEIRLTLHNNKPATEQLGLHRLNKAVESFGAQAGLMTSVVHAGDMEVITPLQWGIIHKNVSEALTNTAKYAVASAVHVEIRVLKQYIKAVVSDNGRGAARIIKGIGLSGMEERTAAVSGTVIADGKRGFTVTTLIPYGDR